MTIDRGLASEMLADVDSIVARVKQSRIYRRAGGIFVIWGVLQFVRQGLFFIWPRLADNTWFVVDFFGVAVTLWLLRDRRSWGGRFPWRALGAFALFYAFGYLWAYVIGAMEGRQLAAFWPTLFHFGFALAGLWLGPAFLVIGLGAAALTIAQFFWAGDHVWLSVTLINGCALIAVGLWMRRA